MSEEYRYEVTPVVAKLLSETRPTHKVMCELVERQQQRIKELEETIKQHEADSKLIVAELEKANERLHEIIEEAIEEGLESGSTAHVRMVLKKAGRT